jgi:multidrug efflux system membrane fusion protein
VLALIDPRPYQASLDSATAKKQQDEANLANARLDANRYAKLAATAYSSAQQSDTARAQVAQLEAQVRGDQAQIDTARTQLSYTTIVAPIDGRIGLRQVDSGNIARAGDLLPLTVITQLKPISVVFTLPQQALPVVANAMQDGMPEVLALKQGGATSDPLDRGQLAVLDNQVDPATGTIKLKATFPNDKLLLWPGGFVNVRMLVETQRSVVTVPTAAVQRGPRGAFVFVIDAGPAGQELAQRRAVTVGHEDDQLSVIAEGVRSGEQVVVDGAQRLTDGAKVALAGPDGNAPDAVPPERNKERNAPGTAQRRNRSSS